MEFLFFNIFKERVNCLFMIFEIRVINLNMFMGLVGKLGVGSSLVIEMGFIVNRNVLFFNY